MMKRQKLDYQGMASIYENILKKRELVPHERKRYDWLLQRMMHVDAERRWKDNNREVSRERNRAYYNSENGKINNARNSKTYRENNRQKTREQSRLWRINNPHKVEEYKLNERRKRASKKLIKIQLTYLTCVFLQNLIKSNT